MLKASLFDTQYNFIVRLYFSLYRTPAFTSLVRLVFFINFRGFLVFKS